MRILNRTKWKLADLTRFVEEIAKREFLDFGTSKGREHYEKTAIVFLTGKRRKFEHCHLSGIRGNVEISKRRVRVWLNQVADKHKPAIAMVIAHEFRHIYTGGSGRKWELRYRGMARYGYRGDYKAYYADFNAYDLTWYGSKRKGELKKNVAAIEAPKHVGMGRMQQMMNSLKRFGDNNNA